MPAAAPPSDPRVERLLQQAVRFHQQGAFARAERLYRQALAAQPAHAHALFLMGNLALAGGKAPEAEALLARALLFQPGDADTAVCLGNAQAMQGRYPSAIEQYRYALRLRPGYVEVRFNLANALRAEGRRDEAAAEFQDVIRRAPRFAPAQNNYANLLAENGRTDEALAALEAYLRVAPRDAAAHFNRANLLRDRGDAAGATAAYRQSVRADPRFAPAQNNLGVLLHEAGRLEEASTHYERALEVDPVHREALLNLAKIDVNARRHASTARRLRRFLALEPDHFDARTMLALQYVAQRRLGAARTEFERLVAEAPQDARLRVNLANVLQEMRELEPAIEHFRAALAIDPGLTGAHYNLGITLRKFDRPAEALPHLLQAQALDGESHVYEHAIANACRDLRRYDDAERHYLRALDLKPSYHEARVSYSGVLIGSGRFGEGWDMDAARWQQEENAGRLAEYPQPAWSGESLRGRRVLVWAEQAPGDQVMFLEALPDLLAEADRVMLECSPRLVALLERSFPGIPMVPRGRPDEIDPRVRSAEYDCQMPMTALQRLYRRRWEQFPRRGAYLRADPQAAAAWRDRLDALGPGLKVGISWRGGTVHTQQRRRTTDLRQWVSLLSTPGARFVSLQYSDVAAELATLREEHGIDLPHWQEAIDDFDQTAALLAGLDLVISIPTTVIHFAGAMDVPAWVLVPHSPGYRYMHEGARMPWYRSVLLLRQQEPESWAGTFDAVRERLRDAVARGRVDATGG